MMQQISPGVWQKLVMRCFCAGWNKGKFKTIVRLIKLTESEEPMHRSTFNLQLSKMFKMAKNPSQKLQNLCHVCITTKTHVHIRKHMTLRACHTNMYVHHALPHLEKPLHILKVNAGTKIVQLGVWLLVKTIPFRNVGFFWSSVKNSDNFSTKSHVWKQWLCTANAFNNKCNGRSYAQVVAKNLVSKTFG